MIGFIFRWWREILIAVLAAAIWVQQGRVESRDETIGERDATIQEMKAAGKLAEAKSAERGATTGQEAVQNYVEQNRQDAPVVERVVERVRNVCLRQADRDLPVPESAAAPDGSAAAAGDDGDRAFAEAIGRDLEACNRELNKLGRLQTWVKANGG